MDTKLDMLDIINEGAEELLRSGSNLIRKNHHRQCVVEATDPRSTTQDVGLPLAEI